MSNEPNTHVMQAILERVEHKLDKHIDNAVTRKEHEELKGKVERQQGFYVKLVALASAVSSAITVGLKSL